MKNYVNNKKRTHFSVPVLFLYGRLEEKKKAVGYCNLHKCYLEPRDIKEKRCNFKKCYRLMEIKNGKKIK